MTGTAFIFPGQGSQEVGMGIDLAKEFSSSAKVFQLADRVLGFSMKDLIANGPKEELTKTVNTQPAVTTASIAMLEALREKGFSCSATAGHSVGEFSALYCAGVLSMEDAILLTRARGEYMHMAGTKYPGTLAAVIGLDPVALEEVCRRASEKGIVVVANLNCPGQTVISGSLEGIEEAGRLALEGGASKVMPLSVSAAFHSPLMDEAAVLLSAKLDEVNFSDASIPVYCNVTGEPEKSGKVIRELLKKQITSQVLWEKSVNAMISDGIDMFVEIGPGKALAGMLKRIDRRLNVHNLNNHQSFDKLISQMEKTLAVS